MGSTTLRNLEVAFDDQQRVTSTFQQRISCIGSLLYNIRKIIPFLSHPENHTLPLVMLRLGNCNAQLAGLLASATKPQQMIQNSSTSGLQSAKKNPRCTSPDLTVLAHIFCLNQIQGFQDCHWNHTSCLNTLLQVTATEQVELSCSFTKRDKTTFLNLHPLHSSLLEFHKHFTTRRP